MARTKNGKDQCQCDKPQHHGCVGTVNQTNDTRYQVSDTVQKLIAQGQASIRWSVFRSPECSLIHGLSKMGHCTYDQWNNPRDNTTAATVQYFLLNCHLYSTAVVSRILSPKQIAFSMGRCALSLFDLKKKE